MRAHFLHGLACLLLGACSALTARPPHTGAGVPAPAEVADARAVIVLAEPPAEPMIARSEALGYARTAVHDLPTLDDVLVAFRIPEGRTIAEAIAEIEAASPGVVAGANHLYRPQTSDALAARSYANALIHWPEGGCRAVRPVGIVDAGLAPDHPAFAGGEVVQRRFVGGAAPSTDHGALMSDLLIGPGRLRNATLYSAAVIDPALPGGDAASVFAILRAVDWLRDQGVSLVNVSLAGPRNKLLDRGLGYAAADGTVFVAAAGNEGPSAAPRYPAAFPFVLAVTAVDRSLDIYDRAVRGDYIDVAAPGVDILLQDAGRLRVVTGTSAAAPFVTGVIAADPALESAGIAEVRRRLAERALDLGAAGRDPVFGDGLVLAPEACRAG